MLKSPSNPLKPRTIAQNAFKSRAVSRRWFCSIHAFPQVVDVTDCLEKPVKTCQNNLWFCKPSQKGRNSTSKSFFFSLNYKSFPIQSGFEQLSSSIPWRVMAI